MKPKKPTKHRPLVNSMTRYMMERYPKRYARPEKPHPDEGKPVAPGKIVPMVDPRMPL